MPKDSLLFDVDGGVDVFSSVTMWPLGAFRNLTVALSRILGCRAGGFTLLSYIYIYILGRTGQAP